MAKNTSMIGLDTQVFPLKTGLWALSSVVSVKVKRKNGKNVRMSKFYPGSKWSPRIVRVPSLTNLGVYKLTNV